MASVGVPSNALLFAGVREVVPAFSRLFPGHDPLEIGEPAAVAVLSFVPFAVVHD